MGKKDGERSIPKSRVGRLGMLGSLGAGLATDLVGAAGRMAAGVARDEIATRFHRQAAEKMLASLGKMKGLPMKVGQMLSYIDDFIPEEYRPIYRETLSQLQVKARPMRWSELEAQITRELGKKPRELFARFDEEPIAAASIGQVYRAALHDGREVAVKVQYPGIADAIQNDLKNIDVLRAALAVILTKVDVDSTVSDITARVMEECDYGCELNNQEEFRRVWEGDPDVLIPRVVPEFSSDRVLVSEYVAGDSWSAMLAKTSSEERSRYGRTIARFVFRSLYVHEMFNADPHPGNYLFLGGSRVAFLDFGCVQRYSHESIAGFRAARDAAISGERGAKFRAVLRESYGLPPDFDEEEWAFMEEYVCCCFEPLLRPQPYKYSRDYTQRLADLTLKGATIGARKALRKGVWEAKKPGLIFLNRINFGLNSILAGLETEMDWLELVDEIDRECGVKKAAAI